MVSGMGLENAVLDDGNIAVGTFRHHVSTVEYAFSAAHGLCLFSSHNVGEQVQRLDVAVEETGVLHIGQLQTLAGIAVLSGLHEDPQVCLCSSSRELVLADPCAAGHLPVNEDLGVVHFCQHIVKDGGQLFPCVGNFDLKKSGAVEETVQMLL